MSGPVGDGSHRGGAHYLECWSPALQQRIPPWCLLYRRRGRREVGPPPGTRRPRAAAGLCVGGGSAAGAQTHVEINSHLQFRTENFISICFWIMEHNLKQRGLQGFGEQQGEDTWSASKLSDLQPERSSLHVICPSRLTHWHFLLSSWKWLLVLKVKTQQTKAYCLRLLKLSWCGWH